MYFLYSLALSLLFLALLPYFIYQAVRHRKYAGSFKERIGLLPESVRGDGRETIWVHAVSVGEFLAARRLIDRLNSALPSTRIVVSTTTITAQRLARSQFDAAFYFPFDWKFSVRRALAWVNPSAVIILETELWPNFLLECRRRGVATILANGRISSRSFRRYQRVRSFIKRVIESFSLMVMQSEADAQRARHLGAPAGRVRVCGNLKYDVPGNLDSESVVREEAPPPDCCDEMDHQFALSSSPHLIVAGSTAPKEENLLLAALRNVRNHPGLADSRLIIAPRHPERFNEVASLIARSSFVFARRSRANAPKVSGAGGADLSPETEFSADDPTGARAAEVILLDTIGELASIYRFAAVVFVGGSLVPRGGHNIIEPAAFAKPIIVGPHTENFRQIVSDFARDGAVVQISVGGEDAAGSLASVLIRLLSDRDLARSMGERARDILLRNRGAIDCTVTAIEDIMRMEKN
jgi:3-deoxy-D-manno-octulosonic-acid transferase